MPRRPTVEEPPTPTVQEQVASVVGLSVTNSTTIYVDDNTYLSHQIEVEDTGATGNVNYEFEPLNYDWDDYNDDWDYVDTNSSGLITSYDDLDYERRPPPLPYTIEIRITATSQGREVSIDQTFEIVVVNIEENGVPENFLVTGQTSTTIALDWDAPEGYDPNYYHIWVFESGDEPADDRFEAEIATIASRYTVDRLQPDTTYEFYLVPVTDQNDTLEMVSLTHTTAS